MRKISLRMALGAAGIAAVAASGLAYAAEPVQAPTKADLLDAMKGEAFANLKYMTYADAARAHGNPQLADLFERTAQTERQEHFAEHAKLYGLAGSDAENLTDAIHGENAEATEMYQGMAQRAEAAGDRDAARHFHEVALDEAKHRDAYGAALAQLGSK